jgi:hypothetical protein
MAHIWVCSNVEWSPVVLESTEADFGWADVVSLPANHVRFFRHTPPGLAERWFLLGPFDSGIRVNGRPLSLGLRLLADRDELRSPDGRVVFFSLERLARVLPCPDLGRTVLCPRCKLEIQPGQSSVQCPAPGCEFWYHELPDRPCWSYAETCALCPQPTALTGEYRWTPDHHFDR